MTEWLDGAIQVRSPVNGGSMIGGPPRAVWHTWESGYALDPIEGAKRLIKARNQVHLVFNPVTGRVAQILPASVAGRGLRNLAGGVQTNRQGTACLQVEVIGYARRPWTDDLTPAGRKTLGRIIRWIRGHGVPDVFPAGDPPIYPDGHDERSVRTWTTRAGHYGHSQVPENDHGDPGKIDPSILWASAGPEPEPDPDPDPRPAPVPTPRRKGALMIFLRTPSNGTWLIVPNPQTADDLSIVRRSLVELTDDAEKALKAAGLLIDVHAGDVDVLLRALPA